MTKRAYRHYCQRLSMMLLLMCASTAIARAQGGMTNGENHLGAIASAGEIDAWTFTANQGDALTIAIGEVGADSAFWPWIRLQSPGGTFIANTWGPLAAQINTTAPQTGTYTVLVASNDSGNNDTGSYQLTLARTPASFVVPDGDQGGAMTNGENHPGVLHRADLDLWSFTAVQGASISIAIGEVGDDTPFWPWIRVRGPDGATLGNTWGAVAAQLALTAPATGTYTVVVASNDSGFDATGNYLLTLAMTPGTPTVPTGDEGGPIVNGENHAGTLHRGDLDQWTIDAVQGASLTIAIGEVGDNTPFWPWIRLRGPDGAQLANTWGALAAQINVTIPATGTYTVVVGTNDSGYAATGNYLLTTALTPGAFVVPVGDEGGAITLNAVDYVGAIHRGDLDQWRFSAVQGTAIVVSIGEVGDNTPFWPWIRLRAPNGDQIRNTWGAVSAQLSVTAPQTGLYTIVVGSNDSGYAATGNYKLWVSGISSGTPSAGANLQITKTGLLQGDTLTYTLTAINHGPDTASAVVVTDNLPAGVSFVSCTAPGGTCNGSGNARTISYGSLAVGVTQTITLVTTKAAGTSVITNIATIASNTTDPAPGNNTASHVLTSGADTDNDTLPNAWETDFGLDPASSDGDNGAGGDPDGDGVVNTQEFANGTHPRGFFTRFLAEGALNSFFDLRLALLNVGATPARLLRRYLQPGGLVVTQYEILQPRVRRTLGLNDLGSLSSDSFSTVVESDQPIVLDRTMSWGGGYGSHAESGASNPATTWYLAEGSTSSDFSLFYLLQNPNAVPTTATVTYLLPFGLPPLVRQYELPALSRTTIPVDDQGDALANTDVSAVISAPVPIMVERAMYKSTPFQPFAAGHGSAGVTAPATSWFLAEGATGPFFDCFILLANPNGQDADVTVDYLLSDGTTHAKSYVVPANGRFTIWVDSEEVPAGSGLHPLENVAVSSTVTSTLPIVVERTMWWPGPGIAANFWTEAHNSPGATATGTRWALAEGEVGGVDATETYILIANTSSTSGLARVTLYFEDGTNAQREFPLLPRSRFNVGVSAEFPSAQGRRFGAEIESLGDPAAQIVVERAMYTSPGGVTWNAGTNALAARIQ
jgi:uncharacterized repeat protein (TIGR01451 family)